MKTIEAIFIAFGESPDVLALASGKLEGVVQQGIAIGDRNPATNEPATTNCIIIKLPLSSDDDSIAIRHAQHWLEKNFEVLGSTDARKILEFHTFLDSNDGSRTLTVPNSILRLCGELGLDISTQAIRAFPD